MKDKTEHINPKGLFKNPAFPQIVTTQGSGKTMYIGGQNAVNEKREIIGIKDFAQQTEQVMKNLEIALEACGATFENLIKLNIYAVQGQDVHKGFEIAHKYLGQSSTQPIVTVLFVAGLVHPHFLLEIDAIAYLPED